MTSDSNQAGSHSDRISRRRILALSGIGIAGGIAGCSGDGGGTDTPEDDPGGGTDTPEDDPGDPTETPDGDETPAGTATPGGTPLDSTFTTSQPGTLPADMQWNPYNQDGGYPRDGQQFEFTSTAAMLTKTQETYPIALSDWSLDGTTATIELNDWFTWSNGDDVTAKDLETQLVLAQKMGYPYISGATDIQQTEDYTLEITLETERNAELFWTSFHKYGETRPTRLEVAHSEFAEYREMFEDVTTATANQDAVSELGTWAKEEPVGNGPYHLNAERTTEDTMYYERNEDYPTQQVQEQFAEALDYDVSNWPDENQIPEWEVTYSAERKTELMLSDTLDSCGLTTITPELREESPDHMQFLSIPVFTGTNLVPNLDDEIFGRRRVRQALAYLIPYEQAGDIMYGDLAKPDTAQTTLTEAQRQSWLSQDFLDSLNNYELDREKATSLLEEEGFSRDGGTWYDGDGNQITAGSIPIPASLSQKVKAFNAIAQSFTDFGIEASVRTSDWSGWSDAMDARDYKLAHSYMGGGPHPYNALVPAYGTTWWKTNREFYEGQEVELPSIEGSGTMTVEPTTLLDELETDLSREEQEERVRKLVWTVNHDLTYIGLTFKDGAQMRTTDHWRQPEREDKMSKSPGARYLQMYNGLLQPKFEE